MARHYSVIIEGDREGHYLASVPALRGCHAQADSLDELLVRIKRPLNCAWRLRALMSNHSTSLGFGK